MYGAIALIGSPLHAKAVLLPMEQRHISQAEQWAVHLQQNQEMVVSTTPIALAMADWILRKLQQTMRSGKGKAHISMEQQMNDIAGLLASTGVQEAISWRRCTAPSDRRGDSNESKERIARQQVVHWLQGRKLLYDEWLGLAHDQAREDELPQVMSAWRWLLLHNYVQMRSAVEFVELSSGQAQLRCLRCYDTKLVLAERSCAYCGERCYYCSSCLQMGRARTCAALIVGRYRSPLQQHSSTQQLAPERLLSMESFGLSDAQLMATTKALTFIYQRLFSHQGQRNNRQEKAGKLASQFLLWAVTGAGKTEMIFPLVAYMIRLGGMVLLATPRRDVVLELSPRLHKAFPELSIVTLYGGSDERWQHGQLVLATTHQLMRFQHAFDLVIIDELDAFPYHGDERLYRVAEQSRTRQGITILLSATPPAYLQRELRSGKLAHVKLPVRYHRHPLPVPIRLKTPLVAEQLSKHIIPRSLQQALAQSLQEEAQIFVFLQRIVHTEAYAMLLRQLFPDINIQATSSQDPDRSSKVMAFRQREIRILVTTTILERGVTVPRSHVYICDAEAELFDEAALVQMAGRAGRSGDAPNGAVYFLSQQWNAGQKRAIKQIQSMNKLAMQQGYLLPQYLSERR